ncbi:MAG: rod shape-determining protein [Candidatus Omnitrophica bacterium]|nr:rod shape-determining protein [Candidatus Omnitrophota bacterium]MCF7877568.1 rod shape-determining protein [Candidatus Omnitrophota bacterium]MCF7892069.1 rod shape-determining protein [Candidatus Omnitrophota bacterium]MCF7896041.1 rod shape-determining protein [Candidatus Omnitrophota bacterium]MCF7897811.1 rod shape-determining protein [Candidatus Omnitrophota bacterium]
MKFISNTIKKLGYLFDSFSSDIGIDLGTATTLVYLRGEGIVLCEPSVVAIYKNTGTPMAVGEEAKQMLGRTPGSIIAIRPLKDGVIADFDITEEMLRYFIKKAHPRRISIGPRIVVAVPSGITEVEKRAVKDSANRAGAREVIPVEEPIVAAIGVGLPIAEPQGNMIIDIGGGTTEIAVISLGGIVHARSMRTGGDEMDSSIVDYMKKNYNLMVGERTAEEIKIKLGSAWPLENEMELEVRGRDLITGLPKFIKTTSEEIREALQNPLKEIVETTKVTLERTPPELAADLIERGIVLCGGGALLKGIDKLISEETGLACFVADDPLTAVALGTGKILESPKFLKKLSLVSTF